MASSLVRTEYIEVDSGRIAFDDTGGPGHIVLCIPGMGDLRSEYRLLGPDLKQAEFRVVTMDVRGFGETSARWTDYSARSVGLDAISIVRRLGAGPATITGNSFAAGSCMDAPVHASSSSSSFERVIGCGHVSGLLCGSSTTAGRYGATRTWCKISSTSSWLTDPDAFPDPLSPIFVLTVR